MPISYTSPVTVPNDPNRKINQLYAAGDALSQMLGAFAQRRERRSVDAEQDAAFVLEAVSKGQLPPDSASVADALSKLEKRDPGRARVYRDMIEWIKANPEQPDPMETFYNRMDQNSAAVDQMLPIDAMAAPPGMGAPPAGPMGPMDIGGGGGGGMAPLGPGMPGGMPDFMGPQGAPFTPQAAPPQGAGLPSAPANGGAGGQLPVDIDEMFDDTSSIMVQSLMSMPAGQRLQAIGGLDDSQRKILYSQLEEVFDPMSSGVSGEQIAICLASDDCAEQNLPPKYVAARRFSEFGLGEGTPGQQREVEQKERKVDLEERRVDVSERGAAVGERGVGVRESREQRLREGGGAEGEKKFKEKTLPSAVAKEVEEFMGGRDLQVSQPSVTGGGDLWVPMKEKPPTSEILRRVADNYNWARREGYDDQAAAAYAVELLKKKIRNARRSLRD